MTATQADSRGHVPTGRWAFDADVTACFSDMLERSIPQYEVMRRTVLEVGSRFVSDSGAVVALGCSRGDDLGPFLAEYGGEVNIVGVEVSRPMIEAARERFAADLQAGHLQLEQLDLRDQYPDQRACLTLAILTLQFVPIEYRQQIVRRAFHHTAHGGALIVVEKVLGATADIDDLFVERYLEGKARNGYSGEEIDRKRHSLEGVLVPVTARWNEELLRAAGFQQVDCFWRWCNFAAWVAVKD